MKERWVSGRLGDFFEVVTGGTPPKSNPEMFGDYMPLVKPPELNGREVSRATDNLSLAGAGSSRVLPTGSVLVSCIGNLGKLGLSAVPLATNQQINAIKPNEKVALPKYVFYWAMSPFFSESLRRKASGTTVPIVNKSKFSSIKISLPPLPEQKRIVAILDEAFAGIATAVANTEKNLANARELFRTSLAICFAQYRELPHRLTAGLLTDGPADASGGPLSDGSFLAAKSSTRGRAETDRIIEGKLSLSVGMPSIQPRRGWRWTKLTNVARLESGHTPSRKRPEYWGGDIPWLGITDARGYNGRVIEDTEQHTNQLGIDNSAARILPAGTVCLSRTASVGYVVITGAAMATSQDFVNWVCSSEVEPHFLKYLLQSEWRDFSRFSSGSVHQTIYFPEVKAFHICHPGLREQKCIVEFLDEMRANATSLESIFQQKLNALTELKQSLLQKAFSGELTTAPQDELETALA